MITRSFNTREELRDGPVPNHHVKPGLAKAIQTHTSAWFPAGQHPVTRQPLSSSPTRGFSLTQCSSASFLRL